MTADGLEMQEKEKIKRLSQSSFLNGLPKQQMAALAACTEEVACEAGDRVLTKGEGGTQMYFIMEGRFRVHDGQVVLAILSDGEVFGDLSALDAQERSASVTAEDDARLLCLDSEALYRVISQKPDAFKSIIRAICKHERKIISSLTERTRKVAAYEKELEIGRRIQAGFLPQEIPEFEGWNIASYFKAAREVAGDFFDVFQLPNDKYLALVIGDVCDKGVGAALFMTLFRSLTRASCLYGCMQKIGDIEKQADIPETILLNSILTTNRYIATTHGDSSMFASMFFGILDTETRQLVYVNGGHEAPLIFCADGSREMLATTGPVLGLFTTANYTVKKIKLEKEDLLFAYTDGVTEAKNDRGELFSEEQLLEISNPEIECPQAFLDDILRHVHSHCNGEDQFDDITMLAVKCHG
jgi:sigma-B regulation protein RsbU (phosphoserine phosphatase)